MSAQEEVRDPLPFDPFRPVEGFRSFLLRGGFLTAVAQPYVWMPGPNRAVCLAGHIADGDTSIAPRVRVPHPPDKLCAPSCGCGFWAFSMNQLTEVAMDSAGMDGVVVMGRVKLWGRVQPFQLGYRGEYAELIELWDTTRLDLQVVARNYRVPIVAVPEPIMSSMVLLAHMQALRWEPGSYGNTIHSMLRVPWFVGLPSLAAAVHTTVPAPSPAPKLFTPTFLGLLTFYFAMVWVGRFVHPPWLWAVFGMQVAAAAAVWTRLLRYWRSERRKRRDRADVAARLLQMVGTMYPNAKNRPSPEAEAAHRRWVRFYNFIRSRGERGLPP